MFSLTTSRNFDENDVHAYSNMGYDPIMNNNENVILSPIIKE